jgi:hypothetical protein
MDQTYPREMLEKLINERLGSPMGISGKNLEKSLDLKPD